MLRPHRHRPGKTRRLAVATALALAGCAQTEAPTPLEPAANGAAATPAQVLGGLGRWHLTLPTSATRQAFPADEIDRQSLARYSGEFFRLNAQGNGVLFIVPVGGATTSGGTAFARTELRERNPDGSRSAWDCRSAERRMTVRQRILQSTVHKPEISVGQIHDARSDNLQVFYKGPEGANGLTDSGRMYARFNGQGLAAAALLDDAYRLGDGMWVRVSTRTGVMTVEYRNERSGRAAQASAPFQEVTGGCYFKAGNYVQACSKTNVYGLVNANCSRKPYPPAWFEPDPQSSAVLEMQALSLD